MKTSYKEGFTLLETLVAVTILGVSLSAFILAVVKSLELYENSRRRYTAAQIAQEGMELAFNKALNHEQKSSEDISYDWRVNLVGTWEIDATKPNELKPDRSFTPASNGSLRNLCVTHPTGKYGYCQGGQDKKIIGDFTRVVRVEDIGSPGINRRVKIIVTTEWRTKFSRENFTLESIAFGPNP